MRIIIAMTLGLLVGLALVALLSDEKTETSDDRKVVAAFYPLAYAAEQIGGPDVEVVNLTPPGTEPHDIEISPRDTRELLSARVVLLLGRGFQPQLERAARSSDHTVSLLDTPGLQAATGDPHVWLDPLRYAMLAERIGEELNEPESAERLVVRLRGLDREYRRGLRNCARREIVTSHAAFGYLAARYALDQIAITGVTPEAEPAPRDLERVIQQVRQTGATTVYFETLVSPKLARTVARETAAQTAVLDPLEGLTRREQAAGDDYFSIMRRNLAALRAGLQCR
jgi:zinc transport system substrate-binding protein